MTVAGLAGLVVLAVGMAGTTAGLVRWASRARSRAQAATVLFLFAMMAEMLGGALVYLLRPSEDGLVLAIWLAGVAMAVSVFPLFVVLAREAARRVDEGTEFRARPPPSGVAWIGPVAALVLLNELLMGLVFSVAAGGSLALLAGGGPPGPASIIGAVTSPWFLLTMALEMGVTAVLARGELPRPVFAILLVQSAIMLFSPPAFTAASWVDVSIVVSSALMVGLFVYLMEHLYRHPQLAPAFSRYVVELLAVYALMMGGLWLWLWTGAGGLFAVAVVAEMAIFLAAVVRPEPFRGDVGPPWQLEPAWAFQVLCFIFVAELFMGAVLDVLLQPDLYRATLGGVALGGAPGAVVAAAVANGFWFVATVTNSTWFLAMMGLEMGALVVFKLRESRNRENRVRLGLMMGSYAAFLVFYPSAYLAAVYPHAPALSQVPVLGWNMGVGSYPVAPVVFGAILLTYAVTGGLSVLFGRRVVCSVFCAAPLMFQGTTIDAMKSFNRSSRIGRRYLSSQLRRAYSATSAVVVAGLAFVTSASYLDATGRWDLTILGADPSVFFYAFSFSVLWYVLFIAIPYLGTYNCVTMGWCYTGTILQGFHAVGFYRLKVRRPEVCRACTTVDCAKSCPVGLVDMPGHFRRSGEFRSSKCCGVGNCVGACPYGNLYIYDVRHWMRDRLHRARPAPTGPWLPQLAPSSVPAAPGPRTTRPAPEDRERGGPSGSGTSFEPPAPRSGAR